MIVLWSPIGPSVTTVALWNKKETIKNHILSVALAMALWPGAIIITFFGVVPILTLDYTLQSIHDTLSNQEQTQLLIHMIGKGAANLYQVVKLYFFGFQIVCEAKYLFVLVSIRSSDVLGFIKLSEMRVIGQLIVLGTLLRVQVWL